MKSNAKSSIALPIEELRQAFRQASAATRASVEAELSELDHLAPEGLGTEADKTQRTKASGRQRARKLRLSKPR
jgi:transketolase